MAGLGLLGYALLLFLPGGWISFGLPLTSVPFWARFMLGAVLSPLVTLVQFYALRWMGVPFDTVVPILVLVNAPVAALVLRRRERSEPDVRARWALLLVLVITLVSSGPRWIETQDRAFTGHAWAHADTVYALAEGELHPEEPFLAGVRQAYPWAGAVHLAALTWLIDRPLVTQHQWLNFLWLIPIAAFAMGLAGALGARGLARISAVPWLLFGVNLVGSTAMAVFPREWIQAVPIWGDARYTPWVFKFFFPNSMPFALGLFIALAYLMVRPRPASDGARDMWPIHVVTLLLLAGVGVIYPVLAPAALLLVGARLLAEPVSRGWGKHLVAPVLVYGALLVLGLSITATYLEVVTAERVTGALELTSLGSLGTKLATSLVVTLPLLLGLLVTLRRSWSERRVATVVLVTSGVGSLALHAVISLPHWMNEYKFIYTAAMCLAPFPALAMQVPFKRAGRTAVPLLGLVTLLLAAPLAGKTYLHRTWGTPPWGHGKQLDGSSRPRVDVTAFDLTLDAGERAADLCVALREGSPSDTVLLTRGVGVHLPTLTHRPLYFPPDEQALYGVNRTGDYLVRLVRGYDPELLDRRAAAVEELYGGADGERGQALDEILSLGRPLAIVLEVEDGRAYGRTSAREREARREMDRTLLRWLEGQSRGQRLYAGEGYIVWLIQ